MRLKDGVTDANTGLDAIKRAPIVDHDSGLRCIRIQDISQSKDFYEWGFTETNEKDKKKFLLKKDDVLVARTGATVGVSTYIQNDIQAVYNNGTIRLRFNNNLKPRFAYYTFQTKSFMQYIDNISCVATQPNLRIEGLLRYTLPDMSIEKQDNIVEYLSVYDNLIENNNKRIALLEKVAQELYKEWFVRRKKDDWELVKLSQFGYSLESGSRPKGGVDGSLQDGYPSLGAEVIGKLGEFDYSVTKLIPKEFYEKMKRGLGKDKDILLYKDGAYIGKVTLFMDEFPYKKYAINEHVFLMRSNEPLYQYYLYFTLALPQYFTQMQNLNRNAAQPGLTGKDIDILKLYRPDKDTITKFNSAVEPMLHNIFSLAKQNQNLIKQRDLLLPRLMSGKLEV